MLIKSLKATLALAAILLLVLAAAGCGKNEAAVATVNGEKITQKQLDQMVSEMKKYYEAQGLTFDEAKDPEMLKTLNTMTLEQLITQTILVQEAKKMGVQVTKDEVNKELAQYKDQMTAEKFKEYLEKNQMTESRLKEMVEKDLYLMGLQNKLLEQVTPPSEEQVREYYENNKKDFVARESYEVRHILALTDGQGEDKGKIELEAKTKILAILEELKQGKDFAETAKAKSEDPGTAPEGGFLTFSPGDVVPEFEAAAKGLQPGGMTMEPVKTTYGYHLIKLEKINPEKQKTFEEVKEGIIQRLTEQANQDKIDKFLEEAKKNAQVVKNLDKPEDQKPEENKNEKKE